MYVCICNALKESQVRAAAREGGSAMQARDLFNRLGARPKCGKCVADAVTLYRQEKSRALVERS